MASAAYRYDYGNSHYRRQDSSDSEAARLRRMSMASAGGEEGARRLQRMNSRTSTGSRRSRRSAATAGGCCGWRFCFGRTGGQSAADLEDEMEAGGSRCTAARVKSCMKLFFAQLFSHVGLCALVVGYAIMGAFIFAYLEKDNELSTRANVKNLKRQTLNELYNITGRIKYSATRCNFDSNSTTVRTLL